MENLPFKKYGSIENLSRKKQIENVQAYFPNLDKMDFVVLEKAHGAHFSLQTDGVNIQPGKRNSILENENNFYRNLDITKRYKKKAFELFSLVSKLFDDVNSIQIEGELIGGYYPHIDVKEVSNVSRVQKGVHYCPGYEFFVYDIKYFNGNDWKFVNYDVCMEMFKKIGFFYAEPMLKGKFDEVINFDPYFQTEIPDKLGLPEIEKNIAEGIVIKPVEPANFPNGSRLIFKKKNENFEETFKAKKVKIKLDDIPPHIFDIQVKMLQMVTPNRLDSVISKEGEVTKKDFGKLMGLLSRDVIDTYNRENGNKFITLDPKEKKIITKKLAPTCAGVVNAYFENDKL